MQPLRYISEVASTKTFKSSKLKTLSIMPLWFSKDMEYWKPEQPPPTTPIRRPAGSGSWVAMISRTLFTALSVRRTGVTFCAGAASGVTASGVGVVVVTVLVAMDRNLLGKRLLLECTAGQAG